MHPILALEASATIALSMVLMFGCAVVVRYVFALVAEAKSLATVFRKANDRLQDASIEVRVFGEKVSERMSKLGHARGPRNRV